MIREGEKTQKKEGCGRCSGMIEPGQGGSTVALGYCTPSIAPQFVMLQWKTGPLGLP